MAKSMIIVGIAALLLAGLSCGDSKTITDGGGGPAAPSGLVGQVLSPTKIMLYWHDNSSDEAGFSIYRSDTSSFHMIGGVASSDTTYTDTTLQEAKTYSYYVVAFNMGGSSNRSNQIELTTAHSFSTQPSNPFPANNSIIQPAPHPNERLSWNFTGVLTDNIFFNIYFGTTNPPPLVASNYTTRYYDTGELSYNRTYYWKIVAWDDNGHLAEGPVWSFHYLHYLGLRSSMQMTAYWLAAEGNYVFTACQNDTLKIIDVSNPDAPFVAGEYAAGDPLGGFTISGNRCYTTTWTGKMHILDISNPINPIILGSYQDSLGYRYGGVTVKGNYTYILSYLNETTEKLAVIDVSNPTAPAYVTDIAVVSHPRRILNDGNYLYISSESIDTSLQILNITNPEQPTLTANYMCSGGFAMAILANKIYLGTGSGPTIILDIANPASPLEIGRFPGMFRSEGIAVSGNYVFQASASESMRILDISDPANILLAASYDEIGYGLDIAFSGGYIYLADIGDNLEHEQPVFKIFEFVQ